MADRKAQMRIGILGLGSIGKRHWDNILKLGHRPWAYDPGPNGIPSNWTRKTVIEESDAVVVATPSQHHAQDLIDVLSAGKHVLVEKPFGYDCPEFLDGFMQATRDRTPNLIVGTGFNLRFHSCVKIAKNMVNLGQLGDLKAAAFTVNQKTTKPPYMMDGILRNWCSHEIDLAHWLLGEGKVLHCSATLDDQGNDTIDTTIQMKFDTVEGHVWINADYFSDPEQRYFWIEGDRAGLYCNLVRRELFMKVKDQAPVPLTIPHDTWDDNYLEEMKVFIKSIENGAHYDPLATGEDGVRALYTVMDARRAAGPK